MIVQSKWGIEVDAHRWYVCPECGQEIEVPVLPITEGEIICDNCGNTFPSSSVRNGRLHWQFLGEISDELAEQIISELKEDAEQWGATFTAERTDQ